MNGSNKFFQSRNNFEKYKHIQSEHIIRAPQKEKPLISIVIPTYKKLDMFKITLSSAINQIGDCNYEIVVVNDDPDDSEIEKYLKSMSINNLQYYRNARNLGLFGNWNRCFELARGEWVAILNDDDYLYNFYLEEVTHVLKEHKDIHYLYIGHDIAKIKTPEQANLIFSKKEKQAERTRHKSRGFMESMEKGVPLSRVFVLEHFMTQTLTHPVGALLRRENVIKLGGYNEAFYPSSDWILNVNYTMKYNMYYYNRSLGCRSEGINLSSNIATKLKFIEVDYEFRNELSKRLKIPFGQWYTCCSLHTYAKRMGIINKVNIKEIKNCSNKDILRYLAIRDHYKKVRNLCNYIKQKF